MAIWSHPGSDSDLCSSIETVIFFPPIFAKTQGMQSKLEGFFHKYFSKLNDLDLEFLPKRQDY